VPIRADGPNWAVACASALVEAKSAAVTRAIERRCEFMETSPLCSPSVQSNRFSDEMLLICGRGKRRPFGAEAA